MQVNILEARNQLSQLIRQVQAGDDVVIANRGEPVARLVAAKRPKPKASEPNFVQWLRANPLPVHAQHSADEIDAAIAAERSAWD